MTIEKDLQHLMKQIHTFVFNNEIKQKFHILIDMQKSHFNSMFPSLCMDIAKEIKENST